MDLEKYDSELSVTRNLLLRNARERGAKTFVLFEDGESLTYDEVLAESSRYANIFASAGIGFGDTVLSWQPNCKSAILTWFGANLLGAIYVPINISYRGSVLDHVISNAASKVAVVHPDLVERFGSATDEHTQTLVVPGKFSGPPSGYRNIIDGAAINEYSNAIPHIDQTIRSFDTQSIIYTSGTTGPSKGVMSSYFQLSEMGLIMNGLINEEDRNLVDLPLFHAGGTLPVNVMLQLGGSVLISSGFRTEGYWEKVRKFGCTTTVLLGVMATFLERQEPAPEDTTHGMGLAIIVPLIDDPSGFAQRFNMSVYTGFNMTEISSPILSEENPPGLKGYCGFLRDGVQAMLVDENDLPVPVGQVGELLLRTDDPWAMNSGYYRNPEATANAWRNGWFHTGDGFRLDEEGRYFFVDRMKDAIRRRGENISSFEVEAEIVAHPDVLECAVVGVPSSDTEDDVLAIVSRRQGANLTHQELFDFLVPRMAHFMVPRYIRFVGDLPKTPTNKVRKVELRQSPIDDDVWDREKLGITVKKEILR